MDQNKIVHALTTGLLAGYGRKSDFKLITRGGFDLKSSHFEKDDIVYHDEWTNGGGQEIVKIGDELFTRVYAGGSTNENPEIISKLIYFIQQLKDKTRLFSNTELSDGDWQYSYKILDQDNNLNITVGKETILFQNKVVFIHCFILSPINN